MSRPAILPSLLATLLFGCMIESGAPAPLTGQPDAGNGGGDGVCEGPLGAPISDFTGMDTCCQAAGGDGHCFPSDQVPDEVQPFLEACSDGSACVPDQFLKTGGSVPPADCTAFGGAGVCLSVCVPQVAEQAALLPQDVCSGDQKCVPCISPLDNMPTGACDLKEAMACTDGSGNGGGGGGGGNVCDDPATCEYEAGCAPVIDPGALPACAPDAHCVDQALVAGADPTVVDRLAPCANQPGALCVPDVFLETGGKFTPATCASVANAEGRCLSMALPDVAAQADLLPQATCAANERCSPCYDPLTGADTGACTLSCDPGPTQAPVTFADCCGGEAKCVPSASVPADQQDNLSQDNCTIETDLCVPNQILADGPYPTCSASGFLIGDYTGVCLSDCLDFGFAGIALGRGNCASNQKCAPCEQFGSPTGAPGCPPAP